MKKKRGSAIEVKVGSAIIKIYPVTTLSKANQKRYRSYQVRYWYNGKKEHKKFADLAKAKKHATEKATEITNGQTARISQLDQASYLRSLELLAPTRKPLELACAEIAEAHRITNGIPLRTLAEYYISRHPAELRARTVPEIVLELLQDKDQDGLSSRHTRDLKERLHRFAAAFNCPITNLTGAEIDTWLRSLKRDSKRHRTTHGKPLGKRSRLNYRRAISNLINYAKARKYLPRDWNELESVTNPQQTAARIQIYTPEEMQRLITHCPANLLPFILIAGFAGVRHSELNGEKGRLDWSQIDFEKGEIFIGNEIAKTSQNRYAPLLPNLAAWLSTIRKARGPICALASTENALARLSTTANVKWIRNGLRKSYISYRLAILKDVGRVAEEAGNSPQIIYKNYRRPIPKADAQRWFAIMPADPQQNLLYLPGLEPRQTVQSVPTAEAASVQTVPKSETR